MTELTDRLIKRKDTFILFQSRCIPVHPFVLSEFKRKQTIDFDVFNRSLDGALEWTYQDLEEHPEEIKGVPQWWVPFQTKDGKETKDKKVLRQWLEEGEHEYFKIINGLMYHGKDLNKFPIDGTRYCASGIYVGQTPIFITYDSQLFFKSALRHYKKRQLMSKQALTAWGIEENKDVYMIPATWYTKDAMPLVRLFGKNFAMCYTNEMIRKQYAEEKPKSL